MLTDGWSVIPSFFPNGAVTGESVYAAWIKKGNSCSLCIMSNMFEHTRHLITKTRLPLFISHNISSHVLVFSL